MFRKRRQCADRRVQEKRACKESQSGFVIPPPKTMTWKGKGFGGLWWKESHMVYIATICFRIKEFPSSLTGSNPNRVSLAFKSYTPGSG